MNEQIFYHTIQAKASEIGINPLLLLSGIESLYTFRNVQLNAINYELLDSLILTIFTLRIGDSFHAIAEENLTSTNNNLRQAAIAELSEMSNEEIARSSNSYLQSFASVLNGKSAIRKYHEKALEAAALEVRKTQESFGNNSIGAIVLSICQSDVGGRLNLSSLFIQ